MKQLLITALIIQFSLIGFGQEQGKIFAHTATSSTIFGNYTRINNELINGDPNAKIIITHTFNPNGLNWEEGVYNDHVTGIFYDGAFWNIFNEDLDPMVENSSYNVFVGDPSLFYVHEVTVDNRIGGNSTRLPEPFGYELYFYSNLWDEIHNDYQYLWDFYDEDMYLYTPDPVNIPLGAKFLIHTPHEEDQLYVHHTGSENVTDNFTEVPVFFLDNSPNAKFIVNVDYSYESGTPQLQKNIGVMYKNNRWAIYTEDQSPMPEDVNFNILFSYNNLETQEQEIKENFQVYPNPVKDILHISKDKIVKKIQIYSVDGKLFRNYQDVDKIVVGDLNPGIYFIQFHTGEKIISRKFVKR